MGAGSSYRPPDRGLAPRASSPVMQLTYEEELMALNVPSALLLLTRPSHVFFHFRLILHQLCNWKPQSSDPYALCTTFTCFFTSMPREREATSWLSLVRLCCPTEADAKNGKSTLHCSDPNPAQKD
jgi:hypothetical protein